MILRSGDNLLSGIKEIAANSIDAILYSPYIRVSKLKEIFTKKGQLEAIVVRWGKDDLLSDGAITDFEPLFDFCRDNEIKLYHNNQIHLKVLLTPVNGLFLGSSNFTNKGMGEEDFNLELGAHVNQIKLEDEIYLNSIIRDAEYVTEDYFNQLKRWVEENKEEYKKRNDFTPKSDFPESQEKYFFLSQLPMTEYPEKFIQAINELKTSDKCEDHDFVIHDMSTYNLNFKSFNQDLLKERFNVHPFILALKDFIKTTSYSSIRYGQLTEWLSENCSDRPNPRRWEIKNEGYANVLYNWITYFDDSFVRSDDYKKGRGSDKISFIDSDINYTESIVNQLNRDQKGNIKAPYQVLLIMALHEMNNYSNIDFESLESAYQKVFKEEITDEELKKNLKFIHLPFHALISAGLIEPRFHKRGDFFESKKSIKEIKNKVRAIKVKGELYTYLNVHYNKAELRGRLFE